MKIIVIDYDAGNTANVLRALSKIGMPAELSQDASKILTADGLILPGVGAYPAAMAELHKRGLVSVIKEAVAQGTPLLGICLGMQILFEKGYEVKETAGLGFIPGTVEYMDIDEKVPHMGWNQLHFAKKHPILKYVQENDDVYFVHSYMAHCLDEQLIAYTDYGNNKVTALVSNNNVIGCQFHPEKSGTVGKQILLAFKEMIKCY